jgi:hypothetical protein
VTHEYKTVRLVRAEGPSWDQQAAGYSKQLSDVALEGWELVSTDPWPWGSSVGRRTPTGRQGRMMGAAGRARSSHPLGRCTGRTRGQRPVANIGDVAGDPEGVVVSTVEEEALVTVWVGLEGTDLTPDAADQLAAYLRVAAARARNQQG